MGFQYIIILSIFLTQLCAKDYEMSSIRKVTFLENWNENVNLEEYCYDLLQYSNQLDSCTVKITEETKTKITTSKCKCKQKYININLISEIVPLENSQCLELPYNFDDTRIQNLVEKAQLTGEEQLSNEELEELVELQNILDKGEVKKYEFNFFKVKFATNYSQNSSDLELVIDETSFNEILR